MSLPKHLRVLRMVHFTANLNRTACGERRRITVMSGNHAPLRDHGAGGPTRMVTGSIPTRVGPGSPMSLSAGPLIITAVGCAFGTLAGSGFRAGSGPRLGFPGEPTTITSDGRHCRPKRGLIAAAESETGRTVIMISGRTNTPSCPAENSARSASNGRSSPPSATSRL
jgi:hypothetical protein